MCFQLHSSLSPRLGGTDVQVATLVSGALLGGDSSWREHTWDAPVAFAARGPSTEGRCLSGKTNNQIDPADLHVGIDPQIDNIPMSGLPQLKEAGF